MAEYLKWQEILKYGGSGLVGIVFILAGIRHFTKEHKKNLSISHKGLHSSPSTEFKKGNTPFPHKLNCKCVRCLKTGNTKSHLAWNKGKKMPSHCGFQKGHNFFPKYHTKQTKEKIRKKSIERNAGVNLIINGGKTRFRKGHITWNKNKEFAQIRGKNHPNWQGGITTLNFKIRNSLKYKLWRKSVFERDNYICQLCGKRGHKLEVHHLIKFSKLYKEMPFLLFNKIIGITLCRVCHRGF